MRPSELTSSAVGAAIPLLVLAALFGGMAASGAERLEAIPPAFLGVWMAEEWHCRGPATDESWLRIEPSRISFYESSGPVLAVVGQGRHSIGFISEFSGEGSTWLHMGHLQLEETGDRLSLEVVGVAGATRRVRCSAP